MLYNKKVFIFFFLGLSLLFAQQESTAQTGWEFESYGEMQGWIFKDSEYMLKEGFLHLENAKTHRIVSPALNIPADYRLFVIRAESLQDGILAMGFQSSTGKIVKKFSSLKRGLNEYKISLYDFESDDQIYAFVVDFIVPSQTRIDFIRFKKPSLTQKIGLFWGDFWTPDLRKTPIAFVRTPNVGRFSFITVLYIVVSSCSALLYIYFRSKNVSKPFLKALTFSFVFGGLLFTLRMDYNWARVWSDDIRKLHGSSINERLGGFYGIYIENAPELLEFTNFIKSSIPPGEAVRPVVRRDGDYITLIMRYFLLPVKTSDKARYVWLFDEKNVHYYEERGSLLKEGQVILENVRLVGQSGPGYLFIRE